MNVKVPGEGDINDEREGDPVARDALFRPAATA
jgi:hypothetical protein